MVSMPVLSLLLSFANNNSSRYLHVLCWLLFHIIPIPQIIELCCPEDYTCICNTRSLISEVT